LNKQTNERDIMEERKRRKRGGEREGEKERGRKRGGEREGERKSGDRWRNRE
jgi:hypothetical protein